jgi:hypothetical protein
MSGARWAGARVLAAALAVCGGGCGGAPAASSSAEPVQVKGTVTYKGKPLPNIVVSFNPANVNRRSAPTATATAGADGTYRLSTLVGENTVSLLGAAASKKAALGYFSKSVVLKSGENTVDIDVP